MAESNKFDKAVTRATDGGGKGAMSVPVKHEHDFITKEMSADAIAAVMDDPALEFAPQIYKLEVGEMVTGVLEGNGPSTEFERINKATGVVEEIATVQTWIIASQDGRKRISILSSVQLDRKLPPFVGGLVKIIRGKDINIDGGRRVTEYMVAGTRVEGKIRNWARAPQMIDATATEGAKQLTEGAGNHAAASGASTNAS